MEKQLGYRTTVIMLWQTERSPKAMTYTPHSLMDPELCCYHDREKFTVLNWSTLRADELGRHVCERKRKRDDLLENQNYLLQDVWKITLDACSSTD